MDTTTPILPPDIEAALVAQHGGPIAVSGHLGSHVVMSMGIFRDMMGVGDDEEFEKSVASVRASLAQAAAGQIMSLDEARTRLSDKDGV